MDAVSRLSRFAALGLFAACATHAPTSAPQPLARVDAGPPDAGPPEVCAVDAGAAVVVLPMPIFRNMPLVGLEPAQVPAPTTASVTVTGRLKSAADRCDALLAQKGPSAVQEGGDIVRGEWSRQLFMREAEAYKQGWREVAHGIDPAGHPTVTLWRGGTPFQSVTLLVKNGPLAVLPKVAMAEGFGDATYRFEDLPAPAMAGDDFPLCLSAAASAKVEHTGQSWSQSCPATATVPAWQLPRAYGWSLVKSKDKVSTFQKGTRFAEVTAGSKVKVTLLDKAKLEAAQKSFAPLDEATQAHYVTGTGLIVGGKYMPGPLLLTLKDGQIKANDVVLRAKDTSETAMPAEVLFDRMAEASYWPTLRLVGPDGVMSNLMSKDHDPDKLAAQLTKLLAAPGTDDEKAKRLAKFPGLGDIAEATLLQIAQHWGK